MDKEEKFKVLTDDGKEIECDVLLTFDLEETNKHYVVYTDNTVDSEGNTNVSNNSNCWIIIGIKIL